MRFNKLLFLLLLITVLVLTGCQATDVIAKVSVTSFDALVKAVPDKVSNDSAKGGWAITGLDGKERIILSKDFSSNLSDIALEFDASPFLQAGLDVKKLPEDQYVYDASTKKITMPFEYGRDKFSPDSEKSVLDTFEQIVKTHREIIGYHEEGDHYKITLMNGNSFAWAKEIKTNKMDLLFILNPQPFVDAGVDIAKIKEWTFTKMPTTDKNGKSVQVDIFLKGFNVK
jgi:hypothetical protein